MRKAIVLLSGGIDSAVTLYIAKRDFDCHALIFDYGQKSRKEIKCASILAEKAGVDYTLIKMSLPWHGSSLLDPTKDIPVGSIIGTDGIPDTYVPSRNLIFLSYAASNAEGIGAEAVFIGAHQMDYSNYPDCRAGFFKAFQDTLNKGTKIGVEGNLLRIETPVLDKTKREIVEIGKELDVPFELTWSCYADGDMPCMNCESCQFRIKAFEEAGIEDPMLSKNDR